MFPLFCMGGEDRRPCNRDFRVGRLPSCFCNGLFLLSRGSVRVPEGRISEGSLSDDSDEIELSAYSFLFVLPIPLLAH